MDTHVNWCTTFHIRDLSLPSLRTGIVKDYHIGDRSMDWGGTTESKGRHFRLIIDHNLT